MKTFTIGNEKYTVIKEYRDMYLCIDEFMTNFKRVPKLVRIK